MKPPWRKDKPKQPAFTRATRDYRHGRASTRGLRRGLDPYACGRASAVAMERKAQNKREKEALLNLIKAEAAMKGPA